jgi:hypothetical protein
MLMERSSKVTLITTSLKDWESGHSKMETKCKVFISKQEKQKTAVMILH